jgi:uncharacterized protein YdhG (YjbR/CyaY superfamily)
MATKATATKRTETTTTFTDDEKAAMQERARELKKAKARGGKTDGTADVLEKIAEMDPSDRAVAERIHAIITTHAPQLEPRTWYGMPAYGTAGKATVFFQAASKFKARYATLGFNDDATLDDGDMWPTAYAITKLDEAVEARIIELIGRLAR